MTLTTGCSAGEVVTAAASVDIALTDLARYIHSAGVPEALVLGYGNLDDELVEDGVARLAATTARATVSSARTTASAPHEPGT